ncbi:hypothetical protein WN943_022745 [Citrus x changshan-huyou]
MSGTTPEKDPSPEQKPDETQTEITPIQATHPPKSKDESPDQNQQSQCQLRPPQQSESKRKGKRTSEELRITIPDAVVYDQLRVTASPEYAQEEEPIAFLNPPFERKSEWMEPKFTYFPKYPQSQNPQNTIQTGPIQPGGSNRVQGNPPSRPGRRVKKLLCLCI